MERREIAYADPIAIFSTLADQPYSILLDSALTDQRYGRFSYIATDPVAIVTDYPFERLDEWRGGGAGAGGIWIGYFGYELYHYIEGRVPPRSGDLPECWFGLYDKVQVFDHVEKKAWILASSETPHPGGPVVLRQAQHERFLSVRPEPHNKPFVVSLSDHERFAQEGYGVTPAGGIFLNTPRSYLARIQCVQDYLKAGDCYQVNLSQEFSSPCPETPWKTYLRLRDLCPTPYAAFLNCGGFQVLSASPECFLKIEGGRVVTRPIKGTRPRGATPLEDAALQEELILSQKDRAELLMIVDLERNDLGRVCRPGTVRVGDLGSVESFANVHHRVATVEGHIKEGVTPLEVVWASFPGGSITGAPKVRAMEIIRELESHPRGVYTGAIGWLGRDSAHLNIAIRTMVIQNGTATYHAGGGIVIDSDPAAEYQELLTKVAPLKACLQ